MILITLSNLKKYFLGRLILEIENFIVSDKDKVGVIGNNGCGKTTLLNIISGEIYVEEGIVENFSKAFYIKQIENTFSDNGGKSFMGKLNLTNKDVQNYSGGEKTRRKIAEFLSGDYNLLIADEPTANLDIEGKSYLVNILKKFKGGIIVVSHDRDFLDSFCNKIIEIKNNKIYCYHGNYTDYIKQKNEIIQKMNLEYKIYINEKRKLKKTVMDLTIKSQKIKTTPKRMGNSEARLHKMGGQRSKAKLDKRKKAIINRISQLEVKEKYNHDSKVEIITGEAKIYSKRIAYGNNVCKRYGKRVIFQNAYFDINSGEKVALIGANGTGKTTLMNMIIKRCNGIELANNIKVGYLTQDLHMLNPNQNVLQSIKETSIYSENYIRYMMSKMMLSKVIINNKIRFCSGGELVKIALIKILLSDYNFLILDEPTNYLDINSMEALESALEKYKGTLLIASHDTRLINNVSNKLWIIQDNRIISFIGNYKEYLTNCKKMRDSKQDQLLILENEKSRLIGLLSEKDSKLNKEDLENEYYNITKKIKEIRDMLQCEMT